MVATGILSLILSVSAVDAEAANCCKFYYSPTDSEFELGFDAAAIYAYDNADPRRGVGVGQMISYRGGKNITYVEVCDRRTDGRVVTLVIFPLRGGTITYANRCGQEYALGYPIEGFYLKVGSAKSGVLDAPRYW